MKIPNPNLVRYIRPARLQLWCARHGVLTGRWTQERIDEILREARRQANLAIELGRDDADT